MFPGKLVAEAAHTSRFEQVLADLLAVPTKPALVRKLQLKQRLAATAEYEFYKRRQRLLADLLAVRKNPTLVRKLPKKEKLPVKRRLDFNQKERPVAVVKPFEETLLVPPRKLRRLESLDMTEMPSNQELANQLGLI